MALTVMPVPGDGMYANSYMLLCKATHRAALVDPTELDEALALLKREGATLQMVLLTHGHFDHIIGVDEIKAATGVPVYIHSGDVPMLGDAALNGSVFFGAPMHASSPDGLLTDGQRIQVGESPLTVLHTPGHSPGSVCFWIQAGEHSALISGDTLFLESIGRTDLWGGDMAQLIQSIQSKLFTLDGEITVYPGHGGPTTIAHEREYNPLVGLNRGGGYAD